MVRDEFLLSFFIQPYKLIFLKISDWICSSYTTPIITLISQTNETHHLHQPWYHSCLRRAAPLIILKLVSCAAAFWLNLERMRGPSFICVMMVAVWFVHRVSVCKTLSVVLVSCSHNGRCYDVAHGPTATWWWWGWVPSARQYCIVQNIITYLSKMMMTGSHGGWQWGVLVSHKNEILNK